MFSSVGLCYRNFRMQVLEVVMLLDEYVGWYDLFLLLREGIVSVTRNELQQQQNRAADQEQRS